MPTVTQVLRCWSGLGGIRPEVLAAAAQRGQVLHHLCHLYVQGRELPPCEAAYQGYLSSFRLWFDTWVEWVWLAETVLTDPVLGFQGTPDLILTLKGDPHPSLWDLKTARTPNLTWRPQVAAYRHLARRQGFEVQRVGVVRLSPEGAPPLVDEYTRTASQDFMIFLSALNCWRFFRSQLAAEAEPEDFLDVETVL